MSRERTRPTRDETRERLFEAAARVFEERGIGAASIETIAAAAGFSRGAFYSNFAGKEELIIGMLEDHAERSLEHYRDLLARHRDPSDFISALRVAERNHDPLGRAPLLHMELILFVARAERRLPELAKRLRARRALTSEIVSVVNQSAGRGDPIDPIWAGSMLLALEDGFRLHRLIDPDTTPADSFLRAVSELQKMSGLGQSRRASSRSPQKRTHLKI
jgi:AcrR family transcriptional regulator